MFNWCATQGRKLSAFCVSFSDLGSIVRLLLLQSGYRYRTKVLGWLLANFDVKNYMQKKSRITMTVTIYCELLAHSYNSDCCHTFVMDINHNHFI